MMTEHDLTTESGVLAYLQQGPYPTSIKASRLAGGSSGFVYRVTTKTLLENGVASFILKHVQGYAARASAFKLDQNRLAFEHQALTTLHDSISQQLVKEISFPAVLHYDDAAHVLILEDLGNVPTLKEWLVPAVSVDDCYLIGCSLATFASGFHMIHQSRPSVIAEFDSNDTAKQLSAQLYFGNLPAAAAKFGFHDAFISEAAAVAQKEVLEAKDVLTLGDFWPGNILVVPHKQRAGSSDPRLFAVDLEFAKPGTASFDIGQMAAELYCLARFRDEERGWMVLLTFLNEYRADMGPEAVDIAKVAIRAGAHLVVIGPLGWGKQIGEQKVQELVAEGVKLIGAGWRRDKIALEDSFLEWLHPYRIVREERGRWIRDNEVLNALS